MNPSIIPAVRYRDADAGVQFLKSAFGAEEKEVHRDDEGIIRHAELRLGDALVMVGQHWADGWLGERLPVHCPPRSAFISSSPIPTPTTLGRRPSTERAWCASSRTRRMAHASTACAIPRATSGRSEPTIPTTPDERLTGRWRTRRYGAAIGLTLVGVACGAAIPGTLGGTLATALIGIGLVGVVSLVFYEVGLSEDRDRAARRPPGDTPGPPARPGSRPRPAPRRPDRLRGHRRRLR